MNSELIINKLKKYYNLNSNAALAKKLGISNSTLSGWTNKRGIGNWELIFEKCKDIDLNWLIKEEYQTPSSQNANLLSDNIAGYNKSKCELCEEKERLIEHLRAENEQLWKLINGEKNKKKVI